jgi:hypothetical protein
MSLIINESNVYIFNPIGKYTDSISNWAKFMEEDFTIFIRSKILLHNMKNDTEGFLFSRNGMHSGISVATERNGNRLIKFSYWFWQKNIKYNENGEIYYDEPIPIQKNITYYLLPEELFEYNDFIMQCDHNNHKILCYINKNLVGEIDYTGLDKCSYEETYMWFGCGNMVTESIQDRHIGEFEYDLFFCLDKVMDLNTIDDIKNNYKQKYTKKYLDLLILNDDIPFKNNIYFFLDFTTQTMYKLWNMSFNGHYPNLYIENNTMF